jgi:hypothetical protein
MKIKRFNENKEEFDPKELEMGKRLRWNIMIFGTDLMTISDLLI